LFDGQKNDIIYTRDIPCDLSGGFTRVASVKLMYDIDDSVIIMSNNVSLGYFILTPLRSHGGSFLYTGCYFFAHQTIRMSILTNIIITVNIKNIRSRQSHHKFNSECRPCFTRPRQYLNNERTVTNGLANEPQKKKPFSTISVIS
jgi:hypothetical protein